MCGRFTSLLSPELLAAIYGMPIPPYLLMEPRYNIAPSQPVLVVRQDISGHSELASVNWGLIPSWAKDPSIGYSLINARAETVAEKPSFRASYRHRRCIIPASGYFEWQPVNGKKQPWYIKGHEDQRLSLAGLWEHWQSEDGSENHTRAIITTSANELMTPIHDRMPLIIGKEYIAAWLDLNTRLDDVAHLLRPCASEMLEAYPVSNLVNNPKFDSPSLISRV
jgi:putative SOS response-associated peptidase YedK